MKQTLLAALLALATLPAFPQAARHPHTFTTQGDHFTLDGKPFKVISGELHYARIPRQYWRARLRMAHAMGLNTIATYVFWNVHEPTPDHFDFTGNADLAEFIREAQQEGLYVILRAGPYSCAEWEFGGFPAWLLNSTTEKTAVILSGAKNPRISPEAPQISSESANNPGSALRSNDPAFMVPAERWINRLAKEIAPLQIGRGGPILMTQVENEYGNFGSDHAYIQHLKEIFLQAGFTASLLYTADNWRNIPNGSIPSLFSATNFGINNHQGGMDALEKLRPGQPLFVSEYWPGWFDHWGHPHETRPTPPQLVDVDYILHRGAGINIYMVHGGTSFGFMSGSSLTANHFLPDVTSYDYDAPIDEAGHPTPKYFAYRKLLAQFAACPATSTPSTRPVILTLSEQSESKGKNPRILPETAQNSPAEPNEQTGESCLPAVPAAPPVITVPTITVTKSTPLWDNLPKPIPSEQPHPMEYYNQSYGYILYCTQLPAAVTGDLVLYELHDYAQIYLDGKLAGTLDRRDKQTTLPIQTTTPTRLDILVANDGRINSTRAMRTESKGITHAVTLAGNPLTNWQIYPLPMTTLPAHFKPVLETKASRYPEASASGLSARQQKGALASGVCPPSGCQYTPGTPTFYQANFSLAQTGDTFLDIRNLGKGALWINHHPIGRFWNIGPQDTLYVPGPWLRKGRNEIVVFDMAPTSNHPTVTGLDHPILNGPVPDQATSKQE